MTEFQRLVPVARIRAAPSLHAIAADVQECAALAGRFGLIGLDRLEATVTLERRGEEIVLSARLSADLAQACTVTLEPVPERIEAEFALTYRPGIDEAEADRLALVDPEGPTIEPLPGDAIDIGEAVAQELSLSLDPYPRAPDAVLGAVLSGEIDDGTNEPQAAPRHGNPFAALKTRQR